MSELEIEGTFEEQWGVMKATVKKHEAAIEGNGKEGLRDFMVGLKAQQRLIIGLLVFLSAFAAVASAIVAVKSIRTGRIAIPSLSHSSSDDPALSFQRNQNQLAGDPPAYIQGR